MTGHDVLPYKAFLPDAAPSPGFVRCRKCGIDVHVNVARNSRCLDCAPKAVGGIISSPVKFRIVGEPLR